MFIRLIYTVFLGILVSLFIGWGIAAFYPAPVAPTYPEILNIPGKPAAEPTNTPAQENARRAYERAQQTFSKEVFPAYNRNVSVMAIVAAIIVLMISLIFLKNIELLSDGLLFGGVLTLLYAIIRGLLGEDPKYGFMVVVVGLVTALVLGYVKFIHPEKKK